MVEQATFNREVPGSSPGGPTRRELEAALSPLSSLDRFVAAQERDYATALAELRAGDKRSHWMWYVFPQLAGLGSSAMAQRYAIASLDEARAYLSHPLLGARLDACVAALAALEGTTPERVLGAIDAVKLRSSLTLFVAAGAGAGFADLLTRWYGSPDPRTLALLGR